VHIRDNQVQLTDDALHLMHGWTGAPLGPPGASERWSGAPHYGQYCAPHCHCRADNLVHLIYDSGYFTEELGAPRGRHILVLHNPSQSLSFIIINPPGREKILQRVEMFQ
jgi:hypothetical protein